jgi:hypothetical protein
MTRDRPAQHIDSPEEKAASMKKRLLPLISIVALVAALPATATIAPTLAGQKLDSGLGELPHYSLWSDKSGRDPVAGRIAGESIDSGLGELPHYSKWLDKSGRDPMGRAAALKLVSK